MNDRARCVRGLVQIWSVFATSVAGWGLVWALGLVAVGVLVGARTFRRESA